MPRHVCVSCATIHYQNPKVVTGCIPRWQDRILLCRRAIEPRYGLWTLPAGFLENGETSMQGAAREAHEEANAIVDNLQLYGVFNLPHIDQIYMMFRGDLRDGKASPGIESLETALFTEQQIPWHELAFPVVTETLKFYFQEWHDNNFGVHYGDLTRNGDNIHVTHHRITTS